MAYWLLLFIDNLWPSPTKIVNSRIKDVISHSKTPYVCMTNFYKFTAGGGGPEQQPKRKTISDKPHGDSNLRRENSYK